MSIRQTAKVITLGCTGSALKLSTFLISVTAKMTKPRGRVTPEGTVGVESLGKQTLLSRLDFPFMQRFGFNLLAKRMQKTNQCVDSGSILWKKKKPLAFLKEFPNNGTDLLQSDI